MCPSSVLVFVLAWASCCCGRHAGAFGLCQVEAARRISHPQSAAASRRSRCSGWRSPRAGAVCGLAGRGATGGERLAGNRQPARHRAGLCRAARDAGSRAAHPAHFLVPRTSWVASSYRPAARCPAPLHSPLSWGVRGGDSGVGEAESVGDGDGRSSDDVLWERFAESIRTQLWRGCRRRPPTWAFGWDDPGTAWWRASSTRSSDIPSAVFAARCQPRARHVRGAAARPGRSRRGLHQPGRFGVESCVVDPRGRRRSFASSVRWRLPIARPGCS